jgi:hypothetical protein
MAFDVPARTAGYFAGCHLPWFIAGGWAIDLWLGQVTRPHDDVDVAVFRRDQRLVRGLFPGWSWWKILPGSRGGDRVPWGEQEWLELPVHEIHGGDDRGAELELLLQESDDWHWRFRRDQRVQMPLGDVGLRSASGIPILRPEIVLLYKAKKARARDEADFASARSTLSDSQVAWLVDALDCCYPDHPWRMWLERS